MSTRAAAAVYVEAPTLDGSTPRLFYHRVTAESTLIFPTTARVSRPVFEAWDGFVDELNARAPAGVAGAVQTGRGLGRVYSHHHICARP